MLDQRCRRHWGDIGSLTVFTDSYQMVTTGNITLNNYNFHPLRDSQREIIG